MNIFKRFRRSESGQAMVEYTIILALVSVVAIGALGGIGDKITNTFDKVADGIGGIVGDDSVLPADFIPVATAEELAYLHENKEQVFGKGTKWEDVYTSGLDKKYKQVKDIDLSGIANFTPIGRTIHDEFKGTYDGSGFEIHNFTTNQPSRYTGLFGRVSGGTLQNIGLVNVDVTGAEQHAGGLVGHQTKSSTIVNCYTTGKIEGKSEVGGLVGQQNDNSSIKDSFSSANIICRGPHAGGLVGAQTQASIDNSYASGKITGGGNSSGGFIGDQQSNSSIKNSYSTGQVVDTSDRVSNTGGFIGNQANSFVENCYSTGNVIGQINTGGFVGGQANTSITNCYSTGDVNGKTNTGGLIGYPYRNSIVTNSYAIGKVTAIENSSGGLVGKGDEVTVTNSFYDRETTGKNDTGKGIGKSTTEMKDQGTYSNWSTSIWTIETGQYPKLK